MTAPALYTASVPVFQHYLARAQALIDDSAAARKALSALLDELATPADAVAPEAVPGL